MSKARGYCFTINNWQESDLEQCQALASRAQYIIVGKEVGDEGTPHLQGYIYFRVQTQFNTVKKALPRAHIEAAQGSPQQNYEYCSKQEVIYESGDRPMQGKRTELDAAVEDVKKEIKAGSSRPMKRIAEDHPNTFVKFHKGLIALANELVEPRREIPEVVVYFGPTGAGKSKAAREFLGEVEPPSWEPGMGQWFDGYLGSKTFLFEEFRGQLPFGMMLNLLDRYTAKVQYKGGMARFVATKIAITSPLHPREWYKNMHDQDKIDQLMRRITRIVDMRPMEEQAEEVRGGVEALGFI